MLRVFGFIILIFAAISPASAQVRAEGPPNANDGQCFARVMSPEIKETVSERVRVKPETVRIEVRPAVYDTVIDRVLVREATVEHRIIPAVYETVTERVMVQAEQIEKVVVPAVFETYTETIEVEPAREVWKAGSGLFGRTFDAETEGRSSDSEIATGEVLCRVTIPAVTETVTRSRMLTPPTLVERVVPAVFETVTRQVVVEPARVEEIQIPAVYEDRETRVLVSPVQEIEVPVPAEYKTVEKEVVVGGGMLQWAEVLCETNTTRFKIAEIQAALTDAGYPTMIDGAFGPRTERAMVAFQRANNLAAGYLTIETTEALSVDAYGPPPEAVYAVLGVRPADPLST